ncbi:unnamed protein product [Diplocarpon coronariae]|nr:hypothetical protein JHW43_007037 [Diplocarpon mali]
MRPKNLIEAEKFGLDNQTETGDPTLTVVIMGEAGIHNLDAMEEIVVKLIELNLAIQNILVGQQLVTSASGMVLVSANCVVFMDFLIFAGLMLWKVTESYDEALEEMMLWSFHWHSGVDFAEAQGIMRTAAGRLRERQTTDSIDYETRAERAAGARRGSKITTSIQVVSIRVIFYRDIAIYPNNAHTTINLSNVRTTNIMTVFGLSSVMITSNMT